MYTETLLKIEILETDDNTDLKSPTTLGMSLETFIARDLSVMEQHLQSMVTEQNENNDDEQLQTTEKITTEDILGRRIFSLEKLNYYSNLMFHFIGNISESDTSDDENDTKQSLSSISTSQIQQDPTDESSSKPHHHKQSKKRLKTSHSHSTSTDAAALQLSEDEL